MTPRFFFPGQLMPTEPKDAPQSPPGGLDWVSVSVAAAALGVSARAIQKRAARGTLTARKVTRGSVEVWEVDGRELRTDGREHGREPANLLPQVDANAAPFHAQSGREPGANMDASTGANPRTDGREREAELKAEITFLRGIVESDRRDMAELRAALREALRAMPRALPSPAGEVATGAATDAPKVSKSRQRAAMEPETGLSYADVLADLEKNLGEAKR
jgi:hypothetical protein